MARGLSALGLLFVLGGCAVDGVVDASSDPSSGLQRSAALLFVERVSVAGAPNATAQVGARFVRSAGVAPSALPGLLGIPSAPEGLGCSIPSAPALDGASRPEVRLLDVGSLEVRVDGRALALEPRRLPDLFRVMSGVVYAGEAELSGERWQFRADGNGASRIPAFELDARAPAPLSELSLADQPPSPSSSWRLARGAFSVRWSRGEPGDFVLARFEGPSDRDPVEAITCSARDETGVLELDAAWSERVARVARGGRLSIHRLRSRAFSLSGFEQAAVVFDASLSVRIAAD